LNDNLTIDSPLSLLFASLVSICILLVGLFGLLAFGDLVVPFDSNLGAAAQFLLTCPICALCFVAAALSLWLRRRKPAKGFSAAFASFLALIILAVAASRLVDFAIGSTYCPDNFALWSQLEQGRNYPFRMQPTSAVLFAIIAIALLILDRKRWPDFLHAQIPAAAVFYMSLFGLIAHFYKATNFDLFPHETPVTLQSVLAFLLISLAVMLCRTDQGYFRWVPLDSPGARSFARLFPISIVAPIAIGSLTLFAISSGWFTGFESAWAAVAIGSVLMLSLAVLINARSVNRNDEARKQADIVQRQLLVELETSNNAMQLEIAERKRLGEKAAHDATHDALTSLPNRLLFMDRMVHAINSMRRHKKMFALFYIDVDNFKPVNDKYGHQAGDMLLKAFAIRLKTTMREVDTVTRLGGDEFGAIMDAPSSGQHALQLAQRIAEAVCKPYPIELPGQKGVLELNVGVSIGVALFPIHATSLDALVREADTAMFRAKVDGKARGGITANIRLAVTHTL
jgi:diguanylate cyclase (GGDEF)-like protein